MKVGFLILLTHLHLIRRTNTASVNAPLDLITLEDITPLERTRLDYLNTLTEQREKRSSHGLLSAIGSGLKQKLGLIAQGSASASGHLSGSSSGSGYYDHHPEPHDDSESYDHKSFDFWGLKKSVLNTLLQAAKAIKGITIALTGKLIKGSGYLVSAKGKLISAKGEAVSDWGKKVASSAVLSPSQHYHSAGYSEHPHDDYHEYGPSGHHDVEVPSAGPSGYDHYKPSSHYPEKYSSFEDTLHHKTLHGLPSGILILKKIPPHHLEAQESVKVPEFKPLKPREPPAPTFTSFLTNIFASSSHVKPQTPEIVHPDLYPESDSSYKTQDEHKDGDFSSIKPVIEDSPEKLDLQYNSPPPIQTYNFNSLPNQLIEVPQDEYSDFNTHPGFYLNNLATSINSLHGVNAHSDFPTQFPMEFNGEFSSMPLHDGGLQDPRSLNPNYPAFPSMMGKKPYLKPHSLPNPLSHNHVKRAPNKFGPVRVKSPTNYDLIRSISFQLGPRGPVKI